MGYDGRNDTTRSGEGMNTHAIGMIEISLLTTTEGGEQNGGTRTDRGTTINAEIKTTNGVTTIGEMSVGTRNESTGDAQTQVKQCWRAK